VEIQNLYDENLSQIIARFLLFDKDKRESISSLREIIEQKYHLEKEVIRKYTFHVRNNLQGESYAEQIEILEQEKSGLQVQLFSQKDHYERLIHEYVRKNDSQIEEGKRQAESLKQLEKEKIQLQKEKDELNQALYVKLQETTRDRNSLSQFEAKIQEFEKKHIVIIQEKDQISASLTERLKEIDLLKSKIIELEEKTTQFDELTANLSLFADENDRLNHVVTEKIKEIKSLRIRVAQGKDFESDNALLIQERMSLNIALTKTRKEVDELKSKIRELEEKTIHELRTKVSGFADENERLNDVLVKRTKEIESLQAEVIQEKEFKSLIIKERDRVNAILTERLRELGALRNKITQLEATTAQANDLRDKLSQLAQENQRLDCLGKAQVKEIKSLRMKVAQGKDFESDNALLIQERMNLSTALTKTQEEVNQLESRIKELEATTAQLNELKGELSQENQRLDHLRMDQIKEIKSLRMKVAQGKDFESNNALLIQERKSLNDVLTETHKEVDELKSKVRELEATTAQLNELKGELSQITAENERLSYLLVERTKEIESLLAKVIQGKEFESKYTLIVKERDRLNDILVERLGEIDILRQRTRELETRATQFKEKLVMLASEY